MANFHGTCISNDKLLPFVTEILATWLAFPSKTTCTNRQIKKKNDQTCKLEAGHEKVQQN